MILHMRARSHTGCQFRHKHRAAHVVKLTVMSELFGDRQHIYRLVSRAKHLDGFEYLSVDGSVEAIGL